MIILFSGDGPVMVVLSPASNAGEMHGDSACNSGKKTKVEYESNV